MSIKSTARAYLRDAGNAFDRAPAEVALAVFTAALLSYGIEGEYRIEAWPQIAVAAYIAFATAWCATLLHAMHRISWRTRWIATALGAAVAAVYLVLVESIEPESEGWRALMLVSAITLLMLAAPAWIASDDPPSLRLRRINARFLLRLLGIGLYGVALFGGLALALAAIDNLFELKLKSEIYAHTFGWIMLVLVPWVVVGGLESYLRPLDEESDVARVVHRLTAYLVPPLLVLYYIILLLYAMRIALTGELPKNLVSPMVLAAGLLTAVAAVLFDPQPADTRAGQRALRIAPAVFILLVPLGIWALAARINEYGWTEFRLLRVLLMALLFVLAVLATIQLARRRAFDLRVLPVFLAVPVLLAAIGPWSVLNVARRDQETRLRNALAEANRIARPATEPARGRAIPSDLYARIEELGYYLEQHFGEDALRSITDRSARRDRMHSGLADALGFTPVVNDTMPWVTHGSLSPGSSVALDYGTFYRVSGPSNTTRFSGAEVTFDLPGGPYHATLADVAAKTQRRQRRGQSNLPNEALTVRDSFAKEVGELILFEATIQQKRDSIKILRIDGILILR